MPERLPDLTAIPHEVEIEGKKYTLTRMTAAGWGKVEQRITSLREDPSAVASKLLAVEGLSKEERREILGKAYDDSLKRNLVTAEEVEAFRTSVSGAYYQFYLCLQENHPDVSEDEASKLFESMWEELLKKQLDLIMSKFSEKGIDKDKEAVREELADLEREDYESRVLQMISGMPTGNPTSEAQAET